MRVQCLAVLLAVLAATPVGAAVLTFEGAVINGTAGVDGLRLATALAASPDGRNVYATSEGDDAVVVLSRGAGGGLLYAATVSGIDGLDGATAVAVAPGGEHVYVAGAGDDAVVVFARDAVTGGLTLVGRVRDGENGVDGLGGVRGVVVSPDGAHVYAAGTDEDSVVVFARNVQSGALTFVSRAVDGQGGVDGVAGVQGLAVSPDGLHVYAAGTDDDAVAVFARDPQTGALTWVERRRDGANGVDGLSGAVALALSPDGAHLYVAGGDEDAIAVFARDPQTGALAFVEREQEGRRGVNDMGFPLGVVVSPDGGYVFVAASSGRAVVAFARDAATGELLFLERRRDGEDGVEGLIGADGVATSPDGTRVWVSARTSGAVTSFVVTPGITSTTTTPSTTTTSTTIPPCGSRPRTGCRQPTAAGSGLLFLRDGRRDEDRLVWRWRSGDATALGDFGDPRVATGYRLCIWETTRRPRLILDSRALPAERCGSSRRCWRRTKRGFRYADRELRPDGLRTLRLKPGARGKAAITVVGRGRRLGMPRLPLSAPITVQLRSGTGECWSAEYGRPRVNSARRFRAKAD